MKKRKRDRWTEYHGEGEMENQIEIEREREIEAESEREMEEIDEQTTKRERGTECQRDGKRESGMRRE